MAHSNSNGSTSQQSPRHVRLDGRTLEGGGQLVRNALALSALTGRPVTVDHVRGNRGGKTGLKASHAAAIKLLAEISGSKVDGGQLGAQSVTFSPPSEGLATPSSEKTGESRLVSLSDITVKPEYNISLSTPGSVFLIFQALYPYLLHVGSKASAERIKVTITGGTNGTSSPSYDYAAQVMAPNFARLGLPHLSMTLRKRGWTTGMVGMGSVSFSIQPLGNVEDGSTLPAQSRFPRINIMDHERGRITRFDLTVLAPDEPFEQGKNSGGTGTVRQYVEQQARRVLRRALKKLDPAFFETKAHSKLHSPGFEGGDETFEQDHRVPIEIHTSEATSHISQLYILIVAYTSTGFRLGHDTLGQGLRSGHGKGRKHGKAKKVQNSSQKSKIQQKTTLDIVDSLIEKCAHGIVEQLIEGPGAKKSPGSSARKRSCLDQHMRDQIVVFEALGRLGWDKVVETDGDRDRVQEDERYWTLHTKTARWVCWEMLGID